MKLNKCEKEFEKWIKKNAYLQHELSPYKDDITAEVCLSDLKSFIKSLLLKQKKILLENQKKEILKDFEANVLDGNKLEDCGECLIASWQILEWLKIYLNNE